jgi:hypothetical protein
MANRWNINALDALFQVLNTYVENLDLIMIR